MRLAYLIVAILPLATVVALTWVVVRAVSIRVVWRDAKVGRFDHEPS